MAAGKLAQPYKATLVSSGRHQPSAAPGLSHFVIVLWELKWRHHPPSMAWPSMLRWLWVAAESLAFMVVMALTAKINQYLGASIRVTANPDPRRYSDRYSPGWSKGLELIFAMRGRYSSASRIAPLAISSAQENREQDATLCSFSRSCGAPHRAPASESVMQLHCCLPPVALASGVFLDSSCP